ncbi:MAG: hypothetical protein ACREP8_17350, partial [Candidatus Binatia bacterium]
GRHRRARELAVFSQGREEASGSIPWFLHHMEVVRERGPKSGLMGLGTTVRFFSRPIGSDRESRRFEANLLFPNQERWVFFLNAASDGTLQVNHEGTAYRWRPAADVPEKVWVEGVPEFGSRVKLWLKGDATPIEVNLQMSRSRGGLARLLMPLLQPEYAGSIERFFASEGVPNVPAKVLHHEQIAEATQRGAAARFNRFALYLSNGDRIELTMTAGHHARGEYELRGAKLHRPGMRPDQHIDLQFAGQRGAGGEHHLTIRDPQSGYHLEVDCGIPAGTTKGRVIFHEVRIKQSPDPMRLTLRQAAPAEEAALGAAAGEGGHRSSPDFSSFGSIPVEVPVRQLVDRA